jgi:hypothetical protein
MENTMKEHLHSDFSIKNKSWHTFVHGSLSVGSEHRKDYKNTNENPLLMLPKIIGVETLHQIQEDHRAQRQ